MNSTQLNSFKNSSVSENISAIFCSIWNAFDIGKESEPEEYKGKSPLVYYDTEHTLETSLAKAWTFIVETPQRSVKLTNALSASEQTINEKKTWLLDLSRESIVSNSVVIQN